MKSLLARYAARTETLLDALRGERLHSGPVHVEAYLGYSTPDALVARGRVLSRPAHRADAETPAKGLAESFRRFLTDEIAGVCVEAHGVSARTDEEGHFELRLPRDACEPEDGWCSVRAVLPDHQTRTALPVRVPDGTAQFGIISDIDDTLIETGAWSLIRNLRTSLTGTVASRVVHADAVEFLSRLTDGGRNPVFYVSSSPWNLHPFLEAVFERGGLPVGPKFLRDFGLDDTRLVTGTHGGHKGASLDTILAANPDLTFVLLGDTGQHDAEVYLHAIQRHPNRIRSVHLRHAGRIDADDERAFDLLRATGVPLHVGARLE